VRAALLLVALAFATPAAAAPNATPISSDDKALAETLFFAGRGLIDAGRIADACDKFTESYRLDPAPGTLLNLAVCHQKLGKVASAWGEFRQTLAEAKKMGRADRAEFSAKQIAELEPQLPYLKIEVPHRVPGLEVLRNGRVLTAAAWDTELPVDPGAVEIVARAPGYREQKVVVTIALKEHRSIVVPPLELAPAKIADTGWSTTRAIGASTFLVGLASGGLAAYFAVRAADAKGRSDDNCPVVDGDRRCNEVGVSAMKTANTYAWLANGGTALAVVGLGVGTYLFVVGGPRAVRFDVAASSAGLTGFLSGSF
jgi:tetratricopeptide (TPR) repeat protein